MRTPTARTLILDLLATLRPGAAMPVAALVGAGGLFGISENNVRVTVARLVAAGRVVRDERGRYHLGAPVLPIARRARSWRALDRRTRRWDGGWLGLLAVTTGRVEGRGRARALRLAGFAALHDRFWLRPDNLAGSAGDLRAELGALGLPADDLVFGVRDLDSATDARARGLWEVGALQRFYRTALAELETSAARLGRLTTDAAMVESFLVGGRIVRALLVDPLLPDAICPAHARRRLVECLRRYDRMGRLAWAAFLERHDVPYLGAPLDTRADDGSARLAG